MTEIIAVLIGLLCAAYVLGKDNERITKLDKEDEILHDLTACRRD